MQQQVDLGPFRVRRVGYGAMQLATRTGLAVEPDHAERMVLAAVDGGADLIDTAEFYGRGELNRVIGSVLRDRDDVVVATKVGARSEADGDLVPAQRPQELRADVEANLRTLGVDRLDVVHLRRTDAPPGIIATGEQVVDLDSQLDQLVALRDEGKIAAIGLSNVSNEQLTASLGAGIVSVQNSHSLADRSSEAVLDTCRAGGIAWMPYWPLGGNYGAVRPVTELPAVIAAADQLSVTPAQLGLAWLLQHYRGTVLVPGTRSGSHLAENLAVADLRLPASALQQLARQPASSRSVT